MATSTETANVTSQTGQSSAAPTGRQVPCLIGPVEDEGTDPVNDVRIFTRDTDAQDAFGEGSTLADGVTEALKNNNRVVVVGLAEKDASPFTTFFSATESTGDSTEIQDTPIFVKKDSGGDFTSPVATGQNDEAGTGDTTALTVLLTVNDPSDETPDSDEVYLNTDTGEFNANTTHTGVEFQTAQLDTQAALRELENQPWEMITIPDETLNAETHGRFKELLSFVQQARIKRLLTVVGDSDLDPTASTPSGDTSQDIANAWNPAPDVAPLVSKFSGDLPSAWCAYRASIGIMGTTKEQLAPLGPTYDKSQYKRIDFGADQPTNAGQFHNQGWNATFRSIENDVRITNDRAFTGLNSFTTFFSNTRGRKAVEREVARNVVIARRRGPESLPLNNDGGIQALKGVIESAFLDLQLEGVVGTDPGDVVVKAPTLSDVPEADRIDRVIDFFDISARILPQIHVTNVNINLNV